MRYIRDIEIVQGKISTQAMYELVCAILANSPFAPERGGQRPAL